MSFRDLDEFLVVPTFDLPIRGKTYRFPGSVSGHAGLVIQRLAAVAEEAAKARDEGRAFDESVTVLTDSEDVDLRREILGDVEAEMVADGLTSAHIEHVFRTLMVWHMGGQEAAERAWEAMGGDPPVALNRAARRTSSSTGAGSGTPSRASSSGTKSPRKRAQPAAPARRGGKSSATGS